MTDTKGKLNFYKTTLFLWKYVREKKLQYIFFYFGWLFHTLVGVITPVLFGRMINKIVYDNDLQGFLRAGMVYLCITVVGIVLYYLIYELYSSLWNSMNRSLRLGMFEQLQRLSASGMSSLPHGETVDMIQFWSYECIHFMIRNVVHNANNIFRILLCIVSIFLVNPVFGVITLVMVPASVAATFRISSRIRKNSEKSRDSYGKYLSWLFEVIGSLGEWRLWSAESLLLKKYDQKLEDFNRLSSGIELDNTIGQEVLANVKNVILVIQYGLLAFYAVYGDLTIGTITVMLSYFTMLSTSLSDLVSNNMDAQMRIAVVERIRNFLFRESVEDESGKRDLQEIITELSFDNCSFRYGSDQPIVLDGVRFSIRRGEKVAVVGSSGSGKSTLLHLLLGLYEPTEGRILLNGRELTEYKKTSLYRHISVVFQEVLMLQGTIRENLWMGESIPEEKLIEACRAAGIYEYILEQEDGFDAKLEQWGKNLSGGQRQRLGIARAYLRNSDLVIMDEATSALDSGTEEWIVENWEEILRGRTCIVVSHRLRTVMGCDRVILLKEGKIHAEGTPMELQEHCQAFQELFAL